MSLFVMASLPSSAAGSAMASALVEIQIISAQFMAALAMRLRSFLGGIGGYSGGQRGSIVLQFLGKRLVVRPASLKSLIQSANVYPVFFGQFGKMVFDAINRKHSFSARVSGLLFSRCPAAIRWFVIPIRIDAFNRHFEWARPHIFKKCGERVLPALANLDSSTSII